MFINNGITTVQQPPLYKKATQQNKEGCKRAAEPIACSNLDSNFTMDFSSKFTTDEKFKSKKDLIKWAREVGSLNGFGIVTLRSDNGGNKRPRVTLGCKRSGTYDNRPPKKEIESKGGRPTGTKKCDCPFRLKGHQQQTTDWELTVVNGRHNHEVEYLEVGPSFLAGLSSSKEKDDDVRPMESLNRLQKDNERHDTTTSQCLRKVETGRSEMQPLLSKLSEYNYIEQHRTFPETDTIVDFFLTHATSLDLLRTFPHGLILYCTLMSEGVDKVMVLEIYGLTSTDIEFFVGLVFLSSEQKDRYEWAFRTLRGLMVGNGIAMPDVIAVGNGIIVATTQDVVDLMEAIEDVFVKSKLLLRPLLIRYLVKQDCKVSDFEDDGESFLEKLDILVSSSTALELERQLLQLRNDFHWYPEAVEYVTNTWLKPYKEKFVQAWTDAFMHFGIAKGYNRSGTVFEDRIIDFICTSSPPVKKQILQLEKSFEEIHAGLQMQNNQIKASFESSLTMVETIEFWYYELKDLRGFVSIKALELVEKQITLVIDGAMCCCAIRRTHGLPCAHEIAEYKIDGQPIPLECIHPHWTKLDMEPLRETAESSGVNEKMKRRRLSKKMNTSTHFASPSSEIIVEFAQHNSNTCSPPILHSKQGRQLEETVYCLPLKFIGVCPTVMRPYILYIEDVASDGHCGFRVVASLLGNSNEDGWIRVRSDLIKELEFNSAQYAQLFMSEKRVDELHHALAYFGTTCLYQKEHWMTMPDMGHIIASCYNVVLMLFSSTQCLTFFPLRTVPLSVSSPKEVAIGFVNKHFVQVFLKQGHPMPLMAKDWTRYNEHNQSFIKEWTTPYNARIKDFMCLQPDIYLDKSPIMVDT
ncbi:hypothetical protein M0R45_024918 [Rubus argutus]|uniref:OTU domain-containing protein n=1 Tax=Rubus argutus TaxID=59490 RepID=A0AAW1WVK9_RUBAR